MSGKADFKHTVALVSIAIGAVAVFIGASAAYGAIESGKHGWLGCTAVCGVVGLFQIRRGLKLRNAAVAEGSTIHLEAPPGTGYTTRTGTRKPTFLRKKAEEDGGDEEE